jgi:hypothetical protein
VAEINAQIVRQTSDSTGASVSMYVLMGRPTLTDHKSAGRTSYYNYLTTHIIIILLKQISRFTAKKSRNPIVICSRPLWLKLSKKITPAAPS